jgi:hypothetical protein
VTGPAVDLDDDALQAGIRFRMLAFDRGRSVVILPPR